jgi:Zn-finger domain-containing protein
MSSIEANITIDLPDDIDYQQFIDTLRNQLSNLTGLETRINVREVDDPLSLSPIKIGKIKE